MMNLFRWISRRRYPYEPLITVNISRERLIHNLNEFRKLAPAGNVAPVLKSNAYGHGLVEVARILEEENRTERLSRQISGYMGRKIDEHIKGIPFFVVDSFFEAVALRASGIKTHLLIIGYTRPETIIKTRSNNTSFTISDLRSLQTIAGTPQKDWDLQNGRIALAMPIKASGRTHFIHIKIDTGMRRQGILPEEIPQAIEIIKRNPNIVLEGVCSHLSDADNPDEIFTEGQIALWNNCVKQFRQAFPSMKYWHLSNTDGHIFTSDIEANVSRLGIGLYGLVSNGAFEGKVDLKPVLEMETLITGTKYLKQGEHVGYSKTFIAAKNMTIATIPVGYYEGLDRRLSSVGSVLVGEERLPCPIIGRISMNITIIDVTNIRNATAGLPVVVISNETSDQNSIRNMAATCQTITYELAVKIPAHLKRVVVD